jgi:curved DNA-binding protein
MSDEDYYQVLGVSRTATAEQIRKAYRQLARENHPDVKKDDPQAKARFLEIQEAYDVLGDEQKRAQYDRFGKNFRQAGAGPTSGGWAQGQPVDLGDLFGGQFPFEELMGGFAGGRTGRAAGGSAAGRGGPGRRRAGADVEAQLTIPFETAAVGGPVDVQIDRGGKVDTLSVKVPAGVADGQTMRLAGQGRPSPSGGPPGDLRLTIHVAPHRLFRREGFDLVLDLPITPSEAVLGAKLEVPTLLEGPVLVTVPPGTSSGMKLRLRGKGVVDPQTKSPGDQYVVIKIVVPKTASEPLQAAYRAVQALESSPRQGLW